MNVPASAYLRLPANRASHANSMKAYRYDKSASSGMCMVSDAQAPSPGALKPGQVIVSVKAAALNPIDYKASIIVERLGVRTCAARHRKCERPIQPLS